MVNAMEEKIEFDSLKELYKRVLPALYSKTKELHRIGFKYINEKDVWNYLVENYWKNKTNLELHELISDIINSDNYSISNYVMNNINKLKEKETIKEMEM